MRNHSPRLLDYLAHIVEAIERIHRYVQDMDRLQERGATEEEVIAKIERGERFAAKHGRTGCRCNFPFDSEWKNRRYSTKQVEAYAVEEDGGLVITAIVRFF